MQLSITGKNIEINDNIRKYVEKKIGRLDRYLPNIIDGRVELTKEGARAADDRQIAQVTLRTKNVVLRAEEATADIFASIDGVVEKMQRQADRYKGKRWARRSEGVDFGTAALAEAVEDEIDEDEPGIVRVKRFHMAPMDEEEAIAQMELLGHDFYVFFNVNENAINVLYRRKTGDYGLIKPDLS